VRPLATLSTATGNEVFGSVLISPALLTPPNKQTNKPNNGDIICSSFFSISVLGLIKHKYTHSLAPITNQTHPTSLLNSQKKIRIQAEFDYENLNADTAYAEAEWYELHEYTGVAVELWLFAKGSLVAFAKSANTVAEIHARRRANGPRGSTFGFDFDDLDDGTPMACVEGEFWMAFVAKNSYRDVPGEDGWKPRGFPRKNDILGYCFPFKSTIPPLVFLPCVFVRKIFCVFPDR
jgi:hypothetical protein